MPIDEMPGLISGRVKRSTMNYDSKDMVSEFERGGEAYVAFQYLSREIENGLNALLAKILSRCDMGYLYDTLEAVLREVMHNGVKANMKRIWFRDLNLDINNEEEYRKGMAGFRDVALHPDRMRDRLLDSAYRVVVTFRKKADGIGIDVTNNACVLPAEMERIRERLAKSARCEGFSEAYEDMYDSSEGAGLGIILTALLMKNAGMNDDALSAVAGEDSLTISLRIPRELKSPEIVTRITEKILEDVGILPTFPESILRLRRLCESPDTTVESISEAISHDPSIAADVIRLSNSAAFVPGRRIRTINEAVVIIGMNNIFALLTAAAARSIIDRRYRRFEQVWEHCNRTAFYARNIAFDSGHSDLVDGVFIAALLHDIGKIVLLSTNIDLVNQIAGMVSNRKIRSTTIIEELFIGISHSTIGSLIAERWNFPDDLIEAIRYHHAPLDPEVQNRDLVMIVYLANQISNQEYRQLDIGFYEAGVLDRFGIGSRVELEAMAGRLRGRYDNHAGFLGRKAR